MEDYKYGHLLFPPHYPLEHVRGLLEHRYFLGYHIYFPRHQAGLGHPSHSEVADAHPQYFSSYQMMVNKVRLLPTLLGGSK